MNITNFQYFAEKFEDIKVCRYRVDGFEKLNIRQKKLLYCLYEAANCGRDIIYDQKYKHNLLLRTIFETIYAKYNGNRNSSDFEQLCIYTKRIWASNGIHHHYSSVKFEPRFSEEFFRQTLAECFQELRFAGFETANGLFLFLRPIIFDKNIDAKLVNQQQGIDIVANSANNLYENVTQTEVEDFIDKITDKNNPTPISYGLNSKLIKTESGLVEKVWKISGMYSQAIEKICHWLNQAKKYAENSQQELVINILIEYYTTGDLAEFDRYSIEWVKDTSSVIDFFSGFIEVYGDSLGYKATWESIVWFEDREMTEKLGVVSQHAGWFEKHSPIDAEYKRENPNGMSYKLINVIAEGGDCSPTSPIGVNLPNADWIRANYGSKSINLSNIEDAVDEVTKDEGVLEEFYLPEQRDAQKRYSQLTGKVHTGLHEVIGHGSGKLKPGVGTPKETLKSYSNVIEEARADLVALYYFTDPYLIEIGVLPDNEAGRAEYVSYFVKGLLIQLSRVPMNQDIEESHMRNRALITRWCLEKGKAEKIVELTKIENKTFVRINDYDKLRVLIGQLLREIQRIKSEGDYMAASDLVENYGVKTDADLHKEIHERWAKLGIAPLTVFMNPLLKPVFADSEIVDVEVEYQTNFDKLMLYYSENYSFLPFYN